MNTKNIIIYRINISIFIISNHNIITIASARLALGWPCSSASLARKLERWVALRGAWGEPSSARPHTYLSASWRWRSLRVSHPAPAQCGAPAAWV